MSLNTEVPLVLRMYVQYERMYIMKPLPRFTYTHLDSTRHIWLVSPAWCWQRNQTVDHGQYRIEYVMNNVMLKHVCTSVVFLLLPCSGWPLVLLTT